MALPQVNRQTIEQYLNKAEIIKETIEQITKDFGLFGIAIEAPQDTLNAYSELMDELCSSISSLVHNEHSRLMSILYQIDLTEKRIREGEIEFPNYSLIEVISHHIIARELQKVLSRHYFKSLEQ